MIVGKLRSLGKLTNLIKWYRQHRHQCVQHDFTKSSLLNIKANVPQGSILGPRLFLFYIDGVFNTSNVAEYIAYADDMSGFLTGTHAHGMIACQQCIGTSEYVEEP